jgi:hypothetical protein
MKPTLRSFLIFTTVLILGVAVYWLSSGSQSRPSVISPANPLSTKADNGSRERTEEARSAEPAGYSAPATTAESIPEAKGEDGGLTSAPPRPAGSRVEVPPAEKALFPGTPAAAWVVVGEEKVGPLALDQVGEFPRVDIPAEKPVEVRLRFPDAEPGERVVASVEDGGRLAEAEHAMAFALDENREASFRFTSDAEAGQYRISVRLGPDRKIVTLWVPPAAIAAGR